MCLIHEVGDPVDSCVVVALIGDLSLCSMSWLGSAHWSSLGVSQSEGFWGPLKALLGWTFEMTSLTHWDGNISQDLARHLSPGSLSTWLPQPGSLRQLNFFMVVDSFPGEHSRTQVEAEGLLMTSTWKLHSIISASFCGSKVSHGACPDSREGPINEMWFSVYGCVGVCVCMCVCSGLGIILGGWPLQGINGKVWI